MDGLIKNIEELPEWAQEWVRKELGSRVLNPALIYKESCVTESEYLNYLDEQIELENKSIKKLLVEASNDKIERYWEQLSKLYVFFIEGKKALINYKNDYMSQLQAKASNCGQLQTNGSKRGKGRPLKSFYDYLLGDEETKKATISKMHTLIDGKYGKDVVLVLRAAREKGLISKPTHTAVKKEFGDIGSYQNYDTYMNRYIFTDEELKGMMGNF